MTTKAEALAAKAALVEFLLERGWQQHVHPVYPWRDPDMGHNWSFEAALQIAKRGRVMGSIGLLGLMLKIVFGCFVTLIVVMTLGVAAVAFKKGWEASGPSPLAKNSEKKSV